MLPSRSRGLDDIKSTTERRQIDSVAENEIVTGRAQEEK
jgi:hypothetical protein